MSKEPIFLVVDLFCGAGGTTTGFENTGGLAKVIACVNHDPKAIKSHWLNHKHVKHFEEDIRTLDLTELVAIVAEQRALHPRAKLILWASLECTNFSKAKGGQPRDADSRTLADHLDRYVLALNPDYVKIENVVEFMSWGPLDENGKPVSRRNGRDFMAWKNRLCTYGYYDEWKELNSANYGAYTSRNRLFGCFAKHGLPIAWPEPTHAKKVGTGNMFANNLKPWMPVKDVLEFNDEGQSIFTRKKPLSEKTLERIYAGLIKFVAGGKDNFLAKIYAVASNSHGTYNTESAAHTITTRDAHALVQTSFISKYYSGKPDGKNIPVDGPAGTITCIDSQALVQTKFIVQRNSGEPSSKVTSVEQPARTLTATGGNLNVVHTAFLHAYYGNGDNNSSVLSPAPTLPTKDRCVLVQTKYLVNYHHSSSVNDVNNPSPTITTRDKVAVVQAQPFITRDFSGGGQHSSIEQPAGSILATPKLNLVQPFVMHTNFSNEPSSIDSPHPVITANRKWSYIVNPSHGGHSTDVNAPSPVIVARQDKAPLYLVVTECGKWAIEIYDTDSEMTVKIKEFMAIYGIADIKMRMLKIAELLRIQGFPAGYHLFGNQSDQKKFIGNSVHPIVPEKWVYAMVAAIDNPEKKAA